MISSPAYDSEQPSELGNATPQQTPGCVTYQAMEHCYSASPDSKGRNDIKNSSGKDKIYSPYKKQFSPVKDGKPRLSKEFLAKQINYILSYSGDETHYNYRRAVKVIKEHCPDLHRAVMKSRRSDQPASAPKKKGAAKAGRMRTNPRIRDADSAKCKQ